MPLSVEEQKQLQQLLAKAQDSDAVGSENFEASDDFQLVTDGLFGTGAMTDACKRRGKMPDVQPSQKKPMTHSLMECGDHSGSAAPWNMEGGVPVSMPETMKDQPKEDVISVSRGGKTVEISLPPGVPNVETWGRTMISFGAYKNAFMCYHELHDLDDSRALTYKKWCKDRVISADGNLRDLSQYLCYIEGLSRGFKTSAGPIIPGTDVHREYKWVPRSCDDLFQLWQKIKTLKIS